MIVKKNRFKMRIKRLGVLYISMVAIFACSGCSYREIDNAIQEKINPQEIETDVFTDLDDEDIHYVKKGEVIPDYYEYTDEMGEKVVEGVKGLEYTVNEVQVFDTIYDSGIEISECSPLYRDDKDILESNSFILVDVTANYNENEATTKEEIMGFQEFFAWHFIEGDNYPKFTSELPQISPELVYFSEHAKDGDVNIFTGKAMKQDIDYDIFRKSMKPGDNVNFKLGIIVAKELVEQKNVFLVLRYSKPPANDPVYYVDLLGEFINE